MKKFTGNFTMQAGKAVKGSERIICRVFEDRVYICNGYFVLRMLPFEYAETIQPVTMCDAGNWIIERGERRELRPDEFNLAEMLDKAAEPVNKYSGATLCQRCPAEFPVDKNTLQGYYNAAAKVAAFYNKSFLAAFDPCVDLHAVGTTSAAVMMAEAEVVGIVLPVRASEAARRACAAWFEQPAEDGDNSELETIRAELDAARDAAKAAEIERAAMLDKITEQAAEIGTLRAELDKLHAEQAAAPVKQAADEKPAEDVKSAAEIIAARFTELDGVRAVIKGAGTSAPVVWLAGDTEKHADAIRAAGAKWSGKRSAYYIRVA